MKLTAFLDKFGTNEACRTHLESVRWPNGPVCPHCGADKSASTVGGREGFYRCPACKKQFSVTVGTPMHGSHLPLRVWYLAMYLTLASSKGVSSVKLAQHLGIGQKTAWFLGHRLRAMLSADKKLPLSGIVEADETYIGGKPRNLPKGAPRPKKKGRGTTKTMLFAAIQRGGEARVKPIGSAKIDDIAPPLWRWTASGGAILCSDELASYRWIGRKMRGHYTVHHARGEYARTVGTVRAHVNTVEGFFGLFKRAIVGVWHWISAKHLHRYATEHEFRWNHRTDVAGRIARCLIGQHGRLRFRDLIA